MPPKSTKKQAAAAATPDEPEATQQKSQFFAEDREYRTEKKIAVHWKIVDVPENVSVAAVLGRLRVSQPKEQQQQLHDEQQNDDGNQDEEKDDAQDALESAKIESVRKQSFFSEELTEQEKDLVAKRVAQHQRQFRQYERREKIRKSKKIRAIFDYVSDEEIAEMLEDCSNDEDEVIYRLTQPGYLYEVRKRIASKYPNEHSNKKSTMTEAQRTAYEQLLKKRSETLKKTTNDNAKRQYRMGGRLGLDDAVKQAQQHQQVDPEKAFEGWSEARIRAYQMIDENPNSYFYRFNAPGEVQRRGQWAEDEQKLFFERLREVGANGQWGIFSMKIPGRVGYQCSNFYRLLVETKKIHDPNYVLDDKGKAHYLFDKKTATGEIRKEFRSHNKHSTGNGARSNTPTLEAVAAAAAASSASSSSKKAEAGSSKSNTSTTGRKRKQQASTSKKQTATTTSDQPQQQQQQQQQPQRRQRRRRGWSGRGSDIGSSSDDDFIGYDDDRSGSYTMRMDDADGSGRRRSKRQRRPTTAAIEAGLADNNASSTTASKGKAPAADRGGGKENHSRGASPDLERAMNPLPGFIDPITLEEVVKPAISKYGHVMGYDNWVRCLTSWEGQRNICPLTKKPLSKRDLVILDFDNIEEYRSRIVNM